MFKYRAATLNIIDTHAIQTWLRAGLLVCLVSLGACSEYWPTAMGPLTGEVEALPGSWAGVTDVDIIQLETIGSEGPYSVNLWIAEVDGAPHVFAGDNHTEWVQNMERSPNVRLGVNQRIFELRGDRVTDPAVFERFAQFWEAKYGNRPMNESVTDTYLIRLSPRD